MGSNRADLFFAFGIGAICLAALELAARASLVSPLLVASPSDVVESIPLLLDEGIVSRFAETFGETFAATAVACLVGLPSGWLLARSGHLDRSFRTWVAVIASAPLILLYPIFLVAFGRSSGTIIAIGAVSATPPIILNVRDGFSNIPRVFLEVGHTFRLSQIQVLTKVMIPAAIPTIVTGVRLGIVFALVNVVAVEYVINFGGVGAMVGEMAERYEIGAMYGAILAIVLASAMFYALTERIERWLRPS